MSVSVSSSRHRYCNRRRYPSSQCPTTVVLFISTTVSTRGAGRLQLVIAPAALFLTCWLEESIQLHPPQPLCRSAIDNKTVTDHCRSSSSSSSSRSCRRMFNIKRVTGCVIRVPEAMSVKPTLISVSGQFHSSARL
jgi:hypothetical protein